MKYLVHELLDRTGVIAHVVEDFLLGHELMDKPIRTDLQNIRLQIEQAQDLLCAAYQAIGNLPESFESFT